MSHRLRRALGRRGAQAALGCLVACGALAGVGAASAADDHVVNTAPSAWDPPALPIATGDTVTWNFDATPGITHNLVATGGPADEPRWSGTIVEFASSGKYPFQFTRPGTYSYVCQVHAGTMIGSVTVTGDPVDPPPPTPTTTATPTATATATPTAAPSQLPVDDHRSTPAPTGSAVADTVAPAITGMRLARIARGLRATFTLSETATLTLTVRKGERPVRTLRLQVRAGERSIAVRRLARGRRTVSLLARDATGNRSATVSSSIRVRRG